MNDGVFAGITKSKVISKTRLNGYLTSINPLCIPVLEKNDHVVVDIYHCISQILAVRKTCRNNSAFVRRLVSEKRSHAEIFTPLQQQR